jgi:iron(III) transport system substrate-binding protein
MSIRPSRPAPVARASRPVRVRGAAVVAGLGLVAAACAGADDAATEGGPDTSTVTVYTGRHYGIEPVFAAFTEATGIEVRFTTGSDPELRERLLAEGENTPADVVMTADAANIALAAAAGLLAPLDSAVLRDAVPAELRAEDGTWFALSRRLRVIQYSTERVTTPPTTYAGLGDPAWAGRLCLRPSTHPYTQSLVAALIRNEGVDAARDVVAAWVANDPVYINSDTDLLRAVAAGDCDVALANTYYLGRLRTEDPAFPVAISWPEQDGVGAHVNISAAGVLAAAPNPEAAVALLEWLATDGQQAFSDANFEYPADPDLAPADVVTGFGEFVSDTASIRELGALNAAAVDLLAEVGYE